MLTTLEQIVYLSQNPTEYRVRCNDMVKIHYLAVELLEKTRDVEW